MINLKKMQVKPKDRLKDWVFNKVHTKNLVYNTCWEDPRCDRKLLELDRDSKVVMITSAGCNALDYALDSPAAVHCIDMNPRQNALLELKKVVFKHGSYDSLFQLFGKGVCRTIKSKYKLKLRQYLPDFAQTYWDKQIRFFDGKGPRRTFYHYGTAGTFAWLADNYFKLQKMKPKLQYLLDAKDLDEQSERYFELEDRLLNGLMEWVVNRHFTMALLGVPRSQQDLFVKKYENGAMGFIQECLRQVFTQLPLRDNYFWRLYITGEYTMDCCPEYLKHTNFESLQKETEKLYTYNTTVSQFLIDNPGQYSHYVLLDHQDWLASNNHEALIEEWKLILANSLPGTKILMRSASHEVDFFPDFVLDKVSFQKDLTDYWHKQDRVGTYASAYLGIVN